jgi:hypothetical protein
MAETPNARVACGACGHIEECHLGAGSRCLVCGCGALVPPRAEPPSPTPAERERWREEAEGYAACGTLMSQRFAQRILALLDAVERLAAERDQYERTGRILADTLHVTSEEHDALRGSGTKPSAHTSVTSMRGARTCTNGCALPRPASRSSMAKPQASRTRSRRRTRNWSMRLLRASRPKRIIAPFSPNATRREGSATTLPRRGASRSRTRISSAPRTNSA